MCRLVQIPKQSAREDAEEREPEPQERTVTVLKLTEGLGLTEVAIKVFEGVGWKERSVASTGQGIVRIRAGWLGGDLKEKRSLSARLQCLICSCHPQGLVHRHLYCWTVDMMFQMTHLQTEMKCLLLKLPHFGHHYYFCCVNLLKYEYIFWSKLIIWKHPPHFNVALMVKSVAAELTSPVSEPPTT